MVWVANSLFVTSYWDKKVFRVNPLTGETLSWFNVIENPYGIVWDGQYLWIGSNHGNIYGYTLDGTPVGSFTSPIGFYYTALAWDGENFIVARALSYEDTPINKVDYTGSIIETYNTNLENISQMVWVPSHDGGNLWLANNIYEPIRRVDLDDGYGIEISNFFIPELGDCHAIAHDGSDLWLSNWEIPYYQVDDGILEHYWITAASYSGTVAAKDHQEIQIIFDSAELNTGDYLADIVVFSNDPDPGGNEVHIPVTLYNTGSPVIELSSDNLVKNMLAGFDEDGNVRGMAKLLNVPFGPYFGTILYEMQIRGNTSDELISFKYFDASEGCTYDILETYEFDINDIIGNLLDPHQLNIDPLSASNDIPDWQNDPLDPTLPH